MTPEQALDLLDQVSSRLQADRQTHAACVQAVQVLKKAITLGGASDDNPDGK